MNAKDMLLKPGIAFGAALILLVAFVPPAHAARPATLTPSVNAAASGESFRVDIAPVIGMRGQEAENLRMVLRKRDSRDRGRDLELEIVEYHGNWFLVRMPQDARFPGGKLGGGHLALLNQRGDVLARCSTQCLKISAAPRSGQAAPGSGAAAATSAPGNRSTSEGTAGLRPGRDEPQSRQGMTAPKMSAQAQEAQIMTAPGMSASAKRLPMPVVDFVGIGTEVKVLKASGGAKLVFNLPSDARLNDQAVLMLVANPDEGDTELTIKINGHVIKKRKFNEGAARTFHVRFNAGGILRAGRNELEMFSEDLIVRGMINPPERKIRVDDIVLWFHRDIPQ